MEWLLENWRSLAEIAGAGLAVISLIVKLTPSPYDDELLRKAMGYISFLQPLGQGGLKLPLTRVRKRGEW